MYTLEEACGSAGNLYWIAFLLTARSELSFSLIMEVLDSENGLALISSPQTLPHLRRKVVTKALEAIREEVAASSQQTALQSSDRNVTPMSSWFIGPDISPAQLEKAFIAIDVFPRCALLLTVFEGLQVDDAAELLHSDCELIRRGREAGLWELTRSLGSIAALVPPRQELKGAIELARHCVN